MRADGGNGGSSSSSSSSKSSSNQQQQQQQQNHTQQIIRRVPQPTTPALKWHDPAGAAAAAVAAIRKLMRVPHAHQLMNLNLHMHLCFCLCLLRWNKLVANAHVCSGWSCCTCVPPTPSQPPGPDNMFELSHTHVNVRWCYCVDSRKFNKHSSAAFKTASPSYQKTGLRQTLMRKLTA